jgi:DNA polymerase I
MIVERGRGNSVNVFYRDGEGNRKKAVLGKNMLPYLYTKEGDKDIGIACKKEGGYTGLYGEKLIKQTFYGTEDMRQIADSMQTWENNIKWENKVLADSNQFFDNYEHRVWYIDMEWKIESGEITIVVVRDSQKGEFVWFTHADYEAGYYDSIPCKDHPYGNTSCDKGDRKFKCCSNEREMLLDVANLMKAHDPDIITGWNVTNADCKQLLTRMRHNNIKAGILSPMNRVRWRFGDWEQPIVGRNVIDLMVGFKKLWTLKNGQLPAMSLDAVSNHCLGEEKVPLKDGHDTYYTDFGTYLDYARQDVALLPKLNDLVDVLGYFTALQHIVQCDIRSTPFITKMFAILCMRDEEFDLKIPSKAQFDKVEYEGADIMTPVAGVYNNIGIFDVKAMYHSNVKKYNICWTTLSDKGSDCGNGTRFDMSKSGLLGRQMDYMTNLRNEYKARKAQAKTEEEAKRYDALQYATKSLVASMYGVAGDAKFGMYHPKIADAITYTSRKTLGELRDHAEDLGFKVRYGHTDSIMCEVPTPEKGIEALKVINERMSPIVTEFEKWSESFLVMAKNRYAGLVSWTDGEYHKAERYVKGIEMKQSRLPKAMKNAMGIVIDNILKGVSERETTDSLANLIEDVVAEKIPVADLTIKAKLSNDLHKYAVLSEARAGAKWANDNLGKGYRKDDYFLCTLDEYGEYIAFDDPSEIQGIAKVGFKELARKFVLEKVIPYYEVMNWDYMPLQNSLNGLSDVVWL